MMPGPRKRRRSPGRPAIYKTLEDLPIALRARIDAAILERKAPANAIYKRFGLADRNVGERTFKRHCKALRSWIARKEEREAEIVRGEDLEKMAIVALTAAGRAAGLRLVDAILVFLLQAREALGEGGDE